MIAHFATRSVVPAHVHSTAGSIDSVFGAGPAQCPVPLDHRRHIRVFRADGNPMHWYAFKRSPPFFIQELGPVP